MSKRKQEEEITIYEKRLRRTPLSAVMLVITPAFREWYEEGPLLIFHRRGDPEPIDDSIDEPQHGDIYLTRKQIYAKRRFYHIETVTGCGVQCFLRVPARFFKSWPASMTKELFFSAIKMHNNRVWIVLCSFLGRGTCEFDEYSDF